METNNENPDAGMPPLRAQVGAAKARRGAVPKVQVRTVESVTKELIDEEYHKEIRFEIQGGPHVRASIRREFSGTRLWKTPTVNFSTAGNISTETALLFAKAVQDAVQHINEVYAELKETHAKPSG